MRLLGVLMALFWLCACGGGASANLPPPKFSYNGSQPFPAVIGQAIALTPAVSETMAGYSVIPALPPGLSLNRKTGVISGTPTTASATGVYTIRALHAGGGAEFRLIIGVVEPPGKLSYPTPVQVTVGTAMLALSPTVTGTVNHFAISPVLPAGLAIDATSGTISGTPRIASNLAPYTITASSLAGSTCFVLLLGTGSNLPVK